MGFFGGDKWRKLREDLVYTARGAKQLLPASPDGAVQLLMGGGPDAKQTYRPYLSYLDSTYHGGRGPQEELAKLPEDVFDACALRLLTAGTNEVTPDGWETSMEPLVSSRLVEAAYPLVDQLTRLLMERQSWRILYDYRVGAYLFAFAQNLTVPRFSMPKDPKTLSAAMARGLYSYGLAALNVGDRAVAKRAWMFGTFHGKSSDDPAYRLCEEGLARLG